MPRLIDADALYKTIDQEADFCGGFGDNVITASELRRCIEMVPTIDAVPVVHASWVREADRHNHWHCSACKYVGGVLMRIVSNYCPHCGAVMDLPEIEGIGL